MKTETKIAKKAIKELNKAKKKANRDLIIILERNMRTHEATCERFLEFLEPLTIYPHMYIENLKEKIQDLKQAIKLYEKEGI